jgi:hypothetical protein
MTEHEPITFTTTSLCGLTHSHTSDSTSVAASGTFACFDVDQVIPLCCCTEQISRTYPIAKRQVLKRTLRSWQFELSEIRFRTSEVDDSLSLSASVGRSSYVAYIDFWSLSRNFCINYL